VAGRQRVNNDSLFWTQRGLLHFVRYW